ncbi:hypothetical protein ACLBXM_02305 [Xanthobacteraceae bacterium A53D]
MQHKTPRSPRANLRAHLRATIGAALAGALMLGAAPVLAQTAAPTPPKAVPAPAAKEAPAKPAKAEGSKSEGTRSGSAEGEPTRTEPAKDAEAPEKAQLPDEDVVNDTSLVLACKQKALVLIRQKSPSVEDIFIDMDGLTVAKADTMVGNAKVIGVMMGEAYIQRDKSDNIHRFLCLTGEGGKVLMTFFTER